MRRNPEREAELIDKIAKSLLDYGMDSFVEPLLETFQPFGDVLGFLLFLGVFPFFEAFGGHWHDFNNLLIEDPKGNIDRLITRMNEIRDMRSEPEHDKDGSDSSKRRSFSKRIRDLFRR